MLVIRNKTFSYVHKLGSQRNVSVERPKGKKPDLAYKTPTCNTGTKVLFYTARRVSYLAVV